jgi:hypothetical protein
MRATVAPNLEHEFAQQQLISFENRTMGNPSQTSLVAGIAVDAKRSSGLSGQGSCNRRRSWVDASFQNIHNVQAPAFGVFNVRTYVSLWIDNGNAAAIAHYKRRLC